MRKAGIIGSAVLAGILLTGCGESLPATKEPAAPTEAPAAATTEAPGADETQEALASDTDAGTAVVLDSFTYELREDGSAVITKFTGTETKVGIPAMIGDAPVTEIGQYAFEAAWDVEQITIPESVTVIGEQAFLDCESLTEINIPEGVTLLPRAVFAGCTSLTSLTIPESVAQMQEEALTGCPLETLYVRNPALAYESWGIDELETPCTICAPEGAVILQWAEANGFPTEIQ